MKRCFFGLVRPLFCLVALNLALSLFACAPKREASAEAGVTFTDALGREVTVAQAPERVAALIGSFADVWMLAGGTVCATADDGWTEFGLELEGAVRLGGAHSPSLERLLSVAPDFVLASASTAANVEMREALEAIGITVAYFDVDCFEDYLQMLDVCTDLTGRKDLYETNGVALLRQIEAVKASFAAQEPSEASRRILLLRASSGSVKAKGSQGTILGEMLADMGCINIADRENGLLEQLSVEEVIRQDPYHIFAVTMGKDTEAAKASLRQMMDENPAWGSLSAVREGRFHIMDRRVFNVKPNARGAEAYEVLYEPRTTP
ncbi:MAG: ABC transporter substrate-binding protein [Clostridia bacterium]|nr:ABC transporter substrate-binding protein [Clostridia bacterium]